MIVGLPLSLRRRGQRRRPARRVRSRSAWRERLGPAVPVELHDERFTTRMAQRLGDARSAEDSRAAAYLLEGWLAAASRSGARRRIGDGDRLG